MAMLVAFAVVLGVGGVAFGYYVILPPAIHFLTNYNSNQFNIQLRAKDYYRFATSCWSGSRSPSRCRCSCSASSGCGS